MATDRTAAPALQEELLRRARERAAARTATGPGSADRGPAPLSRAQHRMWLMDRLGHDGASYSVPFATRLRGPLDVDALASALTGLVRRHEILRTRYVQRNGEPCQEVLPAPESIAVPVVPADPAEAAPLLAAEARRPFDLSAGTVPRALVLRHGPQDHTALLTFHHISLDGPSLEIVAEELGALYESAARSREAAATVAGSGPAQRQPQPPSGPHPQPRPPQYADFARHEHRAAGDRPDEGLRHWHALLDGATPPRLPGPAHPPADLTARPTGSHTTPLAPEVPAALRELGRRHRATPFTVALTAAFAALRRGTGQDDLVIGIAGTHRRGTAMRGLVGLCVNTLPLRVDTSGDPSFGTLLKRVRAALLDAQQHADVPFDVIVDRLGAAARGADGTSLVRVTADVLGAPTTLRLPGTDAEYVEVGVGEAKFDLSFGLVDTDRPAALVQYRRAVLDEKAATGLGATYAALLTALATAPDDLPLSQLPDAEGVQLPYAAAELDESDTHPAERILRSHPHLSDAAVVSPPGGPLLAYAVLREIGGPSPAELRAHLRDRLAPDLVPAAVTLLDVLPRAADGTVDPARLPGLPSLPAPEGPHADAVREGFAALLGRTPAPDDDFFALGGHSLAAVQLAERLRRALTLPLTGLDIMQARTPRAVSALLDVRAAERAAASLRPATRPGQTERTSRTAAGRSGRARTGTVLVTGATGGVGSFLLRELAAQGRPVLALARPESAHLVAADGVDVVEGDLTDLDGLRKAVRSADAVIHAASTFTRPEVDVAALDAMVDAWSRGPFVFVSSVDAYGHPDGGRVAEESPSREPLSPYGRAKLDCEARLLRAAGTAGRGGASAVRSPLVWGPHDRLRDQLRWGATGVLYQAIREGRPLAVPRPGAGGHGWYGAAWVHGAALARAVVSCLDAPVHGVANAISGHVSWQDLAAELSPLLGVAGELEESDEVHPDLNHHWHYDSDRLARSLRPLPGEDLASVLASMITPSLDRQSTGT
ncbi:condensation domain-containing protein [Streptomyces endophytica]|uniref:Condensation domain-containing protein n=1 Tax=Streptomyces endophytica TaxID=2991496 RepID=A0ABY6PFM5_9ACTN|nr:condensation domain-containing protein [Streptomyces endophytica]UZJ32684.1 condensation domain-containing protein [Streptomyces endophytica]